MRYSVFNQFQKHKTAQHNTKDLTMKKTLFFVALATALGFNNAQAVDWNWKGDIRYRYESGLKDDNVSATEDHSRDRHRMRVRFGVYPWINEELSAGLQLSTGGTEPTSRNETFDDLFATDDVYLNEAFIDYHPMFLNGNVNVLLGKRDVAKTLIVEKDLVWDGDLTFEGITLQYGKDSDGNEKDGLSAVAGYYVIDENSSVTTFEKDAYIVAAEASYKGTVSDLGYRLGAGYYDFVNLDGYSASTTSVTKPTAAQFTPYDFNIVEFFGNVGGDITETVPWKLYAQYAFNTAKQSDYPAILDEDERNAFLVGLKIGKAKNPGQLEGSAEYVSIGKYAVAPITDSDRNGGSFTNLEGFKIGAVYHLVQNMTIGATYYNFDYKNKDLVSVADSDDRQHLLQADVVVKF
jgi:hypothetical protein